MGLFTRNFDKPGPGVSPDAPRKKGAARFFEGYVAQKPGRFYGQALRPNGFAGNFQHFRLVCHQKSQSLLS